MAKIFCPLYGGECRKQECVVWTTFPIVNPKTGQPTGQVGGEGCAWFGKVLAQPKRK